jgi:hypothetical protein
MTKRKSIEILKERIRVLKERLSFTTEIYTNRVELEAEVEALELVLGLCRVKK